MLARLSNVHEQGCHKMVVEFAKLSQVRLCASHANFIFSRINVCEHSQIEMNSL